MDTGEFRLRQARYNLMKLIEILFNKKTEDRIAAKVPWSRLCEEMEDYVKVTLENKASVILSVAQTNSFDDYILGHSLNVCMLSILMGGFMGYEFHQLTELGLSSLLHDIGKRETPKDIIFKRGSLTDEEFSIIKKHPTAGAGFMDRIYPGAPDIIKSGILEHHERLDGSGYPKGTTDISEYALIISIADVYEAYTSVRAYHDKRTILEGVKCIRETNGLNEDIISAFVENTVFFPSGSYVLLSDESVGKVQGDETGISPKIVIPGNNQEINGKRILDVLARP